MDSVPLPVPTAELRRAFRAEIKRSTHDSAALLGAIGLVAVPAWAIVDHLLEPANATFFLELRVACTLAMFVVWGVILRTSFGARHPEALLLLFLVLPELTIDVMIAQVDDALAVYASGLTLAIYGSAFLIMWHWRYTLALIAATGLGLAIAIVLTPGGTTPEFPGIAFYLATSSMIAAAGHWLRHRLAWHEFLGRQALEREQERSRRLLARLERLSRQDDLTGVANRRSWDETLAGELARSRRTGAPLSVLVCDVDRFKDVNDRHGHPIGDQVLKVTAATLVERVRATDLVARLGGDEFAVLCPDTDAGAALVLANDIVGDVARRFGAGGALPAVTLSVGVASLTDEDEDPDALVVRADRHLYRAKVSRNAVRA